MKTMSKNLTGHEKASELLRLDEAISNGLDLPDIVIARMRYSLSDAAFDPDDVPLQLSFSLRFDSKQKNEISHVYLDKNPKWVHLCNPFEIIQVRISDICAVRLHY